MLQSIAVVLKKYAGVIGTIFVDAFFWIPKSFEKKNTTTNDAEIRYFDPRRTDGEGGGSNNISKPDF